MLNGENFMCECAFCHKENIIKGKERILSEAANQVEKSAAT